MSDTIFHKDFKSMPWWWEWWHPEQRAVAGPAGKDRRPGDRRRLRRPVGGPRDRALGRRRDGAGARRLRRRREHPQRRGGERRHVDRQGLLRQERRARGPDGRADGGHAARCGRVAQAGRNPDRARGHRVPLASSGPLHRCLHARALCRAGKEGGDVQPGRRSGHAHGAARAPARGDCLRLLPRRDGGRPLRPSCTPPCTTAGC